MIGAASNDGSAHRPRCASKSWRLSRLYFADVAQQAEQLLCNQQVVGSRLTISTSFGETIAGGIRWPYPNRLKDFAGSIPVLSTRHALVAQR